MIYYIISLLLSLLSSSLLIEGKETSFIPQISFWTAHDLAKVYYGNSSLAILISSQNGLSSDTTLIPKGKLIKIPESSTCTKYLPSECLEWTTSPPNKEDEGESGKRMLVLTPEEIQNLNTQFYNIVNRGTVIQEIQRSFRNIFAAFFPRQIRLLRIGHINGYIRRLNVPRLQRRNPANVYPRSLVPFFLRQRNREEGHYDNEEVFRDLLRNMLDRFLENPDFIETAFPGPFALPLLRNQLELTVGQLQNRLPQGTLQLAAFDRQSPFDVLDPLVTNLLQQLRQFLVRNPLETLDAGMMQTIVDALPGINLILLARASLRLIAQDYSENDALKNTRPPDDNWDADGGSEGESIQKLNPEATKAQPMGRSFQEAIYTANSTSTTMTMTLKFPTYSYPHLHAYEKSRNFPIYSESIYPDVQVNKLNNFFSDF